MADLAAALLVGSALIGLIFWYFRAGDDSPGALAPASGGEGVAPSTPPPRRADDDEDAGGEPEPASAPRSGGVGPSSAPSIHVRPLDEDDEGSDVDDDITLVTLAPIELRHIPIVRPSTPSYGDEDDGDGDGDDLDREGPSAVPIIYDDDAAVDEPTSSSPLLLISAVAHTDQGQRRKKNEDCYLCLDEHHLFAVADGMGGHAGGEVASRMAVDTIAAAFKDQSFDETPYPDVPRRGSELAIAIQRANRVVYDKAQADRALAGMGTTIVSARFSPNKNRLYVGHVGDSRCYRVRNKEITQLTTDHTMGAAGLTGPMASHLVRALGIAPAVKIDLIIARPHPGDVYLLCSDGLSKMASDEAIRDILLAEPNPEKASWKLVERANAGGGRDNITVVLVRVSDPKDLARFAVRPA